MTTVYHDNTIRLTKPWAWSYSRLKNWRSCGRKHAMVDLMRRFTDDGSPALHEGKLVHDAIARYVRNDTPLPGTMRDYKAEVDRTVGQPMPGVINLVEAEMAIRRDMVPCDYFGQGVWLRVKVDFAKVAHSVAVAVDWKTGQIKEDLEQLAITAQVFFSTYPTVQKVRTQYVWLGNNATTTQDFKREDMQALWGKLLPEVATYEESYRAGNFPPSPSGLCVRHCPVTTCEFHGRGSR